MISLINKPAPAFEALSDNNETVSSDQLIGKWLILYFYPKDNTSGCTAEACSFRDNMERIAALNCNVVGVSPDSTLSHEKFKKNHNLNYILLSDSEKKICYDYGVWVEKSMYGKKYMGVERSTFLINPEGIIVHEWRKVKVSGHVDEIIHEFNKLAIT